MVFKCLIIVIFCSYSFLIGQTMDSISLYINLMDSLKSLSPGQAIEISEKISERVVKLLEPETKGLFFNIQGICYKNQGKYNEAIESYKKSLDYYAQSGNVVSQAGVYNNLGFALRVKGNYKEALNYLLIGLEIFKNEGNTKSVITILNNIGSLYFVQKNYEKAKQYFLEALDSTQKINDIASQAHIYNNLGEIELRNGNYQDAKHFFLKSKVIKDKSHDKRSKANTFANLFTVYTFLNIPDSAKVYYQNAKELYLAIKDSLGIQKLELQTSHLEFKKTNPLNSLESEVVKLEKLLVNLQEQNISPILLQTYQKISLAYAKEKNYQKAYEYYQKFFQLYDSLNNVQNKKIAEQLEAQFNNSRKQERIKILEQQNQITNLEKQKAEFANFWLVFVIFFVLVLLILTFTLIVIKQKNQKILEEKNEIIKKSLEEKELLLREIHHRVKNNLQIISSLLNLQGNQKDISPEDLLKQSKDRIYAMSIIHEKLYQTENFHSIDVKDYIENLLEYFSETYGLVSKNICMKYHIEPILLNIDKIVPLGLVINEIISNAIKYAFEQQQSNKKIYIELKKKEKQIFVTIGDNGKGLPQGFQMENKQSLGTRLIYGLVKQLKGDIKVISELGTQYIIQIPV